MKIKVVSLSQVSLKRKLFISFVLISFLPVLVFLYSVSNKQFSAYIISGMVLNVILGWWIIADIINSISGVFKKVKQHTPQEDFKGMANSHNEVDLLGSVFDNLSNKVKVSFDQLKEISQRTEQLNKEVVRKVSVLSAVLQVNELAADSFNINEAFDLLANKVKNILEVDVIFVFLQKKDEPVFTCLTTIGANWDLGQVDYSKVFLRPLIKNGQNMILDGRHSYSTDFQDFVNAELRLGSVVLVPLAVKKVVRGFMGIGYRSKEAVFALEDIESLEVFARDASLLLEYQDLAGKVQDLKSNDPLTGLYQAEYFKRLAEEEVKKSYNLHKPAGILAISLKGLTCREGVSLREIEMIIKKTAEIISSSVDYDSKAGRIGDNTFAVVMPHKSKGFIASKGKTIITSIEREISQNNILNDIKVIFAVAEAPIDGSAFGELFNKVLKEINVSQEEN